MEIEIDYWFNACEDSVGFLIIYYNQINGHTQTYKSAATYATVSDAYDAAIIELSK